MINLLKRGARWLGHRVWHFVVWRAGLFPQDFGEQDIATIRSVEPYTMTSPERINALILATKYVVTNDIPGDIVECGVWKGGSMVAVMRTLLDLGVTDRVIHLFDTYEGMTEPGTVDISSGGQRAADLFKHPASKSAGSSICYASLDQVKAAVYETGYDRERIRFIKGKVEETLPSNAPDAISILRLDTDWYESTKHELEHLFPRLSRGGIIILDDYGYWLGSRRAVDEYIEQNDICLFLNRIDHSGRIAVKI